MGNSVHILDRLVHLTDDTGADTLRRYFAQIEYTAHCCIRMLNPKHGIESVTPEAGDDVLIELPQFYELHQVKTRSESRGPWPASEVIEIIASQIAKADNLDRDCRFFFVSNAQASSSVSKENCFGFTLFKILRDIESKGMPLDVVKQGQLQRCELAWCEALEGRLTELGFKFRGRTTADCLRKVRFETNSPYIQSPDHYEDISATNVYQLDGSLAIAMPGCQSYDVAALSAMYDRLLLMITKKIILSGNSGAVRKITQADVLDCCRSGSRVERNSIDLSEFEGRTLCERKANLAGFDPTDFHLIARQRAIGEAVHREVIASHNEYTAELLVASLLDIQNRERRRISSARPGERRIGPELLDAVTEKLDQLKDGLLKSVKNLELQECIGLLWQQTDQCLAWWHGYSSKGVA